MTQTPLGVTKAIGHKSRAVPLLKAGPWVTIRDHASGY